MKALFDQVSEHCSKVVTENYSTSFSLATRMLSNSIRQDIYNIYGFVRFADEIVDSFHDFDKESLLDRFQGDLDHALKNKVSLNPILNAFQKTVHQHSIDRELIDAFMKSMKMDLHKSDYNTTEEYNEYIYGSADVVGLMCLQVFVKGDVDKYNELKDPGNFTTISSGIVTYELGEGAQKFFERADEAMYEEKRAKKAMR